jgi:dihydrolipoamide dehydrogenase
MADKYDIAVIGGGPGGYVAAIRCAQLGMNVALVEKRATLGGTCLNVGCIPSKALLDSSEHYEMLTKSLPDHGITASGVKLDLKKLMARKDKVVSEVCAGVDYLIKKNKITRYHGFGSFKSATQINVKKDDGSEEVFEAEKSIIATGSVPVELPNININGKNIITSDHAIALDKVPKHMIIIGAGVIGLELGSVWRRLGAKVSVIEFMPGLLSSVDKQMGTMAQRIFEKQGMEFYFDHKVESVKEEKGQCVVSFSNNKQETLTLEGDIVLVSVGRRPFSDSLNAEQIGIELNDRKRIKVNAHTFQTSLPNIYAIGDITDGAMLAHRAEEEGVAVAEILAGQSGHVNYDAIPWVIYTWPEVAWVGKGEDELKQAGIKYKVGKSFFKANGRAKAMNETDGQVKVLADSKTDELLGVFVVGPRASDMIAEAAVAFEFCASAEDLARSIHAHPTLSEVIKDAAQNVGDWAIHQ